MNSETVKAKIYSLPRPDDSQKKGAADDADDGGLFQGVKCEKPPCPSWLSKEAKKHWRYITAELEKSNLITRLDQGSIAILCTSYARMKEAEEKMQEADGMLQKAPSGYQQVGAWFVIWKTFSSQYNKIANQYGLTLRSRQQVKVSNPNQGELGFDDY